MKSETEKALRQMDPAKQVELVRFMADIMATETFMQALHKPPSDGPELSDDGDAVFSELLEHYGGHLFDRYEYAPDFDRLHEAICENRAQDAVDILTEITGTDFRPVSAHSYLFPDRVTQIRLEF